MMKYRGPRRRVAQGRPHVLLHLDLDHQAARSCTFSLRVIPPSSNRVKCPLSHPDEGASP
jgi:hypothetical protein